MATLHDLVRPAAVAPAVLHERYAAPLQLVRALIGVVPNCDPVLEIWPPAFRSYNVMVPNLLNLPLLLWGVGAPKSAVALAMLASSRAASCMYCTAHTCAFALRRGVDEDKLAPGAKALTAAERAAVEVGEALGAVPSPLTPSQREQVRAQLGESDAEWVVLAIAMMGFLNKFMDAMGIDLEAASVDEVQDHLAPAGWSAGRHRVVPTADAGPRSRGDSLGFQLKVARHFPSAIALDRRWTAGVPARWPAVGELLRAQTGHDFPWLGRLKHGRAIRAIATMLRDGCARDASVLPFEVKLRAGIVFATTVGNETVARDVRALAAHAGLALDGEVDDGDPLLRLARAASPSPAQITPAVIESLSSASPAAIVEAIAWLSLLQLVHRVTTFYDAPASR